MSDVTTNLSRTLRDAAQGTPTNRDMALKLFSGTVLEAYKSATVFVDGPGTVVAKKTLNGGHVAQWPVIGDDMNLDDLTSGVNATWTDSGTTDPDYDFDDSAAVGGLKLGYHEPGKFIEGQKILLAEKTVRVDDTLVAAIDVPMQDLDLSHFDVLRPFGVKLGRALSHSQDKKIAVIAAKVGMGTGIGAGVTGVHGGGHSVIRECTSTAGGGITNLTECWTDNETGAQNFVKDCADMARKFDESNCPEEDRFLFISPEVRRILRWDTSIFNRDFNPSEIANSLNDRAIGMVEGFKIVMTNHLPQGDTQDKYYAVDSNLAKYDYKFDGTTSAAPRVAAIAMCGAREGSAGVGMVQAGGTRTIVEDDHRRGLKFLKSSLMVGFDALSPWCVGTIGCYDSAG